MHAERGGHTDLRFVADAAFVGASRLELADGQESVSLLAIRQRRNELDATRHFDIPANRPCASEGRCAPAAYKAMGWSCVRKEARVGRCPPRSHARAYR